MPTYMIMSASAQMPASCWGRYGRIAVVELEFGFVGRPAMISERARGIARIVETWERLHVGSTDRCAYAIALAEAETLVNRLRAESAGPEPIHTTIARKCISEKRASAALDRLGYRLLGRDPYADHDWHVSRWIDDRSASVTVGHAPTLRAALQLALDD